MRDSKGRFIKGHISYRAMLGKRHGKEAREKMSKVSHVPQQGFQKGEGNPSKNMTLETRIKMSTTRKLLGLRPPPPREEQPQ